MSRTSRKPRALLVGGDHRSTLAAARSLARMSVPFAVLGSGSGRIVASSRHVRHYLPGPDALLEPEAFVGSVLDLLRRFEARLVIPTDDSAMLACVQQRNTIDAEATLAAPPTSSFRNVRDKRVNLETARRLGIPCPAQFELEREEQVPELIDYLGFPIVLKNPGPAAEGHRPRFNFRWLVARDERELRGHLAEHCTEGAFPLFQQLVTGNVMNVCCFAIAGEMVAAHDYVSVRRWEGVGVLREVRAAAPDLLQFAQSMLGELQWTGAAHIGFFVRESDGDARYMETNGRFWGSIEGSVRAGWDFPAWTYRYFAEGERPTPGPLEIGSRTCWHYGDLRALVEYIGGGPAPTRTPRGKPRAVLDYVSAFRPGIHADTFRVSDPLPAFVEHWQPGRKALRRLTQHARVSSRYRSV